MQGREEEEIVFGCENAEDFEKWENAVKKMMEDADERKFQMMIK